jgi:hypothetical protein
MIAIESPYEISSLNPVINSVLRGDILYFIIKERYIIIYIINL